MGAVDFTSMAINEWDGRHHSAIKCDQNPTLDDEHVDKNHKLETKIHHVEEEIKNIDQTCKLIRDTILQKKKPQLKDGYKAQLESLLWHFGAREHERYKRVINEKKTKIDYRRQARIGEVRAIFDRTWKKGDDDTCSSEKELNNRVCSLHFRSRCGKITFVKEKHLLRDIKQLEETRQEIVANDALKQKRFDESMEWVDRPIEPCRCCYRSSRKQKNLKDMDLDKLKREKQVFSARVKNAEEAWKVMYYEIPPMEFKLVETIKKQTAKEKLLVQLKNQRDREKLSYNEQYYNKNRSLQQNAKNLTAMNNIAALEELSHNEI